MTHWRKVGAREGQIYIQDSLGEWHWVTPSHTRRSMHRLLVLIVSIAVALLLSAAVLFAFSRAARADANLPFNLTCLQIIEYSQMFPLPNTRAGRDRAKAIALTFGVAVTDAQLDEAARCLSFLDDKPKRENRK